MSNHHVVVWDHFLNCMPKLGRFIISKLQRNIFRAEGTRDVPVGPPSRQRNSVYLRKQWLTRYVCQFFTRLTQTQEGQPVSGRQCTARMQNSNPVAANHWIWEPRRQYEHAFLQHKELICVAFRWN